MNGRQAIAEPLSVSVKADSAILMNADTGAILYEKNAHKIQYPASITKVATALYTLVSQEDKLDTEITAEREAIASVTYEAKKRSNYSLPAHWLEPGATHMGIKKGEILSLRDLLYGIMLASANDASNMVAQHIGGTVPGFMEELNSYLKELGCKNTHFCNPHGLHHPKHVTTAYEMALITKEALKSPLFRDIVKTVRYKRPKTNLQESTTLIQGNRLLRSGKYFYQKAIGIKTGYTSDAENTFVAGATHEGRTLIVVLLKTKDRDDNYTDTRMLFETAFNQIPIRRVLLKNGPQKYQLAMEGADKVIKTMIHNDVCVDYYPAEEPQLRCKLFWDKLKLPIAAGQRVGEIQLSTENGRFLQAVPVYSQAEIGVTWKHWFKTLLESERSDMEESQRDPVPGKGWHKFWKGVGITFAFFMLIISLLFMRKKKC